MFERISSVSVKDVVSMPRGPRIRSCMTSPRRLPVIPSSTWPAQSMLDPYSHRSPGSKISGVEIDLCDAVMTLGYPWSLASRAYCSLKKS